MIEIICQQCGKKAFVRTDGAMKFCSKKCVGKSQRKRIVKICNICGKSFEVPISANRNDRRKYCSKECRDKSQEGKSISTKTEFKKGHIPKNKGVPQIILKNNKRICKECEIEKDISEFTKNETYVYGREYRCKKCASEYVCSRYYAIPFEKRSIRTVPILTKEQRKKNRKKVSKEYVKRLNDGYIKSVLHNQYGLMPKETTPELIELKREHLKRKRLIKQRKKEVESCHS